jgi:hypothetical protein
MRLKPWKTTTARNTFSLHAASIIIFTTTTPTQPLTSLAQRPGRAGSMQTGKRARCLHQVHCYLPLAQHKPTSVSVIDIMLL